MFRVKNLNVNKDHQDTTHNAHALIERHFSLICNQKRLAHTTYSNNIRRLT